MTWRNRIGIVLATLVCCLALSGVSTAQSCGGQVEITAVGQTGGPSSIDIALNNPSSSPQKTYLVVQALIGAFPVRFAEQLMMPAGTSTTVRFTFDTVVALIGAEACSDRPTGITEAPDPYAMKLVTDEEADSSGTGDEEDPDGDGSEGGGS